MIKIFCISNNRNSWPAIMHFLLQINKKSGNEVIESPQQKILFSLANFIWEIKLWKIKGIKTKGHYSRQLYKLLSIVKESNF